MDPKLKLIVRGNPREELSLLLRLHKANIYPKNCKVISQFGDVISCRILRKNLLSVYDDKATRSLKAPQVIPANYKNSRITDVSIGAFQELHQNLVSSNYKRSPVVFGIIDFGFDFGHRDFQDAYGKTRFEKIWVQPTPYRNSNKYGYGEIFNAPEMNRAITSQSPYRFLGYHPGKNDRFGRGMHGTHVLGIAASSGASGARGLASTSPIVAVDMGSSYVNGSDLSLGDSVKLIEGIDFILEQAGERPCVINLSLGGHCSDHTGKTLVEIALNNAVKNRKATVIVQSTGNYFKADCHHVGILKEGESKEITWLFKRRDPSANEIEVWYEGEDRITAELYTDNGILIGRSEPFNDAVLNYDKIQNGIIYHRSKEPNTGKNHINIILSKRPESRKLILKLKGGQVKNGEYHVYVERDDMGQSRLAPQDVDTNFTIGSICNAPLTIAVGAYNQKSLERDPMSFSSAGPTIDRRVKPEVLAPGNKIVAARSASKYQLEPGHGLIAKSGSSMAAPYVASLAVKILEKFPKLSIYEIRRLLFQSCNARKHRNQSDANQSGYGMVSYAKLRFLLKQKQRSQQSKNRLHY
ncbi:S8 family serine peptidase [Aquimarina sp. ERC-38]|uniref:S8 family serine peptidase n=1 Tax=Aquimarina sp. ERC-38 TaxID=2949996 RepID=UPI0022473A1F|nr:S8 family serine peptidase [Aquimarina sp. ERC-38]UZO82329.1 S8 family serine peptidase [Aquimarina sp. ERC-38]